MVFLIEDVSRSLPFFHEVTFSADITEEGAVAVEGHVTFDISDGDAHLQRRNSCGHNPAAM